MYVLPPYIGSLPDDKAGRDAFCAYYAYQGMIQAYQGPPVYLMLFAYMNELEGCQMPYDDHDRESSFAPLLEFYNISLLAHAKANLIKWLASAVTVLIDRMEIAHLDPVRGLLILADDLPEIIEEWPTAGFIREWRLLWATSRGASFRGRVSTMAHHFQDLGVTESLVKEYCLWQGLQTFGLDHLRNLGETMKFRYEHVARFRGRWLQGKGSTRSDRLYLPSNKENENWAYRMSLLAAAVDKMVKNGAAKKVKGERWRLVQPTLAL